MQSMQAIVSYLPQLGRTQAVRRALDRVRDDRTAADLLFLESWEISAIPGVAAALRASQLRRANAALLAEIRAELGTEPGEHHGHQGA
jgi:hypothetical protein